MAPERTAEPRSAAILANSERKRRPAWRVGTKMRQFRRSRGPWKPFWAHFWVKMATADGKEGIFHPWKCRVSVTEGKMGKKLEKCN